MNPFQRLLECCPHNEGGERDALITRPRFWQNFCNLSGSAWPMAMSFTFSLEVLVMAIFASRVSTNTEHTAAITMFQSMTHFNATLAFSPLLALSFIASGDVGAIRKLDNSNSVELARLRANIAGVYKSGLVLSAVISPIAMTPMFFSKDVLIWLGQDERVAEIAQEFLRWYSLAIPAISLRICAEQMMFSFKDIKPAMYIAIPTFVLGTFLSGWLGLGWLGNNPWGLSGIAVGYVIESALTALFFSLYIACHSNFLGVPFLNFANVDRGAVRGWVRELRTTGSTISLSMLSELAMAFVLGLLAGLEGVEQQASLVFAMQVVFFVAVLSLAFGAATSQELRRLIGGKRFSDASHFARSSPISSLINVLPFCLGVSLVPGLLMNLLGRYNEDIGNKLEVLVPIIAAGTLFDTVRYNLIQAMRATHDWFWPAAISTVGLCSGLGLAALLGLATNTDVYGLGIGYTVGILLAVISLSARWWGRTAPEAIREAEETYQVRKESGDDSSWCGYARSFFTSCRTSAPLESRTDGLSSLPIVEAPRSCWKTYFGNLSAGPVVGSVAKIGLVH